MSKTTTQTNIKIPNFELRFPYFLAHNFTKRTQFTRIQIYISKTDMHNLVSINQRKKLKPK